METLTRGKIRREGLPVGSHVLQIIEDRSECVLHRHFAGMDCFEVQDVKEVADHYRPQEPILVHCDRPDHCRMAEGELNRLGYWNVFRYEGDVADLEPYVGLPEAGVVEELESEMEGPLLTTEPPRRITTDELERLLRHRHGGVHLMDVVEDSRRCGMTVGVDCTEPERMAEVVADWDEGDTVVLRCEPSFDCGKVAGLLQDAGFEDVRLFEGEFREVDRSVRL
jgi:rhodanese-related sulfurtransferase